MKNRFISMFLTATIVLGIIATTPMTVSADSLCFDGGTIAPPINQGLSGAHVINGNALRNGAAALDINVLDLIADTCINANEIYGIQAIIWAPQANTRQIYFEINGVSSPMFHTDTTSPDRIFIPREAVHPITYQLNSPFVSSPNPSAFNVRIRAGNAVWGVGPIMLLGANGQLLGISTYSTQDGDGVWNAFVSACDCCSDCGKDPCACPRCRDGGIIAPPSSANHVNFTNGNTADGSLASLNLNVLDLISGTPIKANDIHGIEVVTWGNNVENRQVTIEVNGVPSPRFHGSSNHHADRIWAIMSHGNTPNIGGRTEQNTLRYMNIYGGRTTNIWNNLVPLTPFVASSNPSAFNVRIRANDSWSSTVTAVSLLGASEETLGTATFTDGSWNRFESFVACVCGKCDDPVTGHDKFSFSVCEVENTVTIEGFMHEPFENVEIPAEIGGLPVVRIGTGAFMGAAITSVILPDTLAEIGAFAFQNCTGLTEITVPASVSVIETAAFMGTGLTAITFLEDETNFVEMRLDMLAFSNTSFTTVTIPAKITNIGAFAFAAANLETVTFNALNPPSVGLAAFQSNPNLARVFVHADSDIHAYRARLSGFNVRIIQRQGDWEYSVNADNSVTVMGYLGDEIEITVPDDFGGRIVTEIGDEAFKGMTELEYVYIPYTVKVIGNSAFEGCTGLVRVPWEEWGYYIEGVLIIDIEDVLLVDIGERAFWGCTSIKSVAFPCNLTKIKNNTFENSGVVVIYLREHIKNIGISAFENCVDLVYIYDRGALGMDIESRAFFGCVNLQRMWFDVGVRSIGDSAFENTFLLGIYFSSFNGFGVETIGNRAFYGNRAYWGQDVYLPETLKSIGDEAFGNSNISSVTFDSMIPPKMGQNVFDNLFVVYIPCGAFMEYRIIEKFDRINIECCRGIRNCILDYEIIGNTVRITGFKYDLYNPHLRIPNFIENFPVTEIGYGAFMGTTISSVDFPDTIRKIKDFAFSDCVNLQSSQSWFSGLMIPRWVEHIGTAAFQGSGITSLNISGGWGAAELEIGMFAFANTSKLERIWLSGRDILLLHDFAFQGSGVSSLGIGSGVRQIPMGAFANCVNLTEVHIPDTVERIGQAAFRGCVSLETLTFELPNPGVNIQNYAFAETGLSNVSFPVSVNNTVLYGSPVGSEFEGVTFCSNLNCWQICICDCIDCSVSGSAALCSCWDCWRACNCDGRLNCLDCGKIICECCTCGTGGVISAPNGNYLNFTNGNTAGVTGRGNVDFDVLALIDGTPIKANDIYGIEATTWGANTQNRQAFIDVRTTGGYVASPRFHAASAAESAWIWSIMEHGQPIAVHGRTQAQTMRYMNMYGGNPKIASNVIPLAPFVAEENPPQFDVRIRANDNHESAVVAVSLLGNEGQILGTAEYSDGEWSAFVPVCICDCGRESDLIDIGEASFKSIRSMEEIDFDENGVAFAKNQFLLTAYEDVSYEQIEALAISINAEIVGFIELTNDYQIEINEDKTAECLQLIIGELMNNPLIRFASLNIVTEIGSDSISIPWIPNDPWRRQYSEEELYEIRLELELDGNYVELDKLDVEVNHQVDWGNKLSIGDRNWGLKAIDVPWAWELAWGHMDTENPVKIGLVDNVFNQHEDLTFARAWYNPKDVPSHHGNHVAGIMAAKFDNGIGLSGIVPYNSLYGFSIAGFEKRNACEICGACKCEGHYCECILCEECENIKYKNDINDIEECAFCACECAESECGCVTCDECVLDETLKLCLRMPARCKLCYECPEPQCVCKLCDECLDKFTIFTAHENKVWFTYLIGNNVRVINYSKHDKTRTHWSAKTDESASLTIRMGAEILGNFLNGFIDEGYDFVIVTSAGNATFKRESMLLPTEESGHLDKIVEAGKNSFLNYIGFDCYECGCHLCVVRSRIICVGGIGLNARNELEFYVSRVGTVIIGGAFIGDRVDVVAPASRIYSAGGNFSDTSHVSVSYQFDSGTSQAAPHVAGIAGLLYSVNPNLTGEQVKSIIIQTAEDSGKSVSDEAFVAAANNLHYVETTSRGRPYYIVNARLAVDMALACDRDNCDVCQTICSNCGRRDCEDRCCSHCKQWDCHGICVRPPCPVCWAQICVCEYCDICTELINDCKCDYCKYCRTLIFNGTDEFPCGCCHNCLTHPCDCCPECGEFPCICICIECNRIGCLLRCLCWNNWHCTDPDNCLHCEYCDECDYRIFDGRNHHPCVCCSDCLTHPCECPCEMCDEFPCICLCIECNRIGCLLRCLCWNNWHCTDPDNCLHCEYCDECDYRTFDGQNHHPCGCDPPCECGCCMECELCGECDKCFCSNCGLSICGCRLGELIQHGVVGIDDAVEILKYIVGLDSVIQTCGCGNGCGFGLVGLSLLNCELPVISFDALRASLIVLTVWDITEFDPNNPDHRPKVDDSIEILKFLVGLESLLDFRNQEGFQR